MPFSRLYPLWMIVTVCLARFIVQTGPFLGLPVFAAGPLAGTGLVKGTYFLTRFWWTRLHLRQPNAGGITTRRWCQFHFARFETCRTTGQAAFFLFGFALFGVVLATGIGTADGGSPALLRRTTGVTTAVLFAGIMEINVVIVVEVCIAQL